MGHIYCKRVGLSEGTLSVLQMAEQILRHSIKPFINWQILFAGGSLLILGCVSIVLGFVVDGFSGIFALPKTVNQDVFRDLTVEIKQT
jgi:hypothetical protein